MTAAGCLGIAVIAYATRWGAAISDDSYFYIHAARDLLAGKGFTLTPHFPPVLPLALTGIGLFGIDPLAAVRWLNAAVFGLNGILAGLIILEMSGSLLFSLIGSLFFFCADALIEAHAWAMSEPLFLTMLLLGFLCLAAFKPHLRQEKWRVGAGLSGLCFGLAAATRYIGVSLILAVALAWLLQRPLAPMERLGRAFVSSLAGILPVGAYMLRNLLLNGQSTDRVLAWHPMSLGLWRAALSTVLVWFLPGRLVHGKEWLWLAAVTVLVLAGGWLVYLRRHLNRQALNRLDRAGLAPWLGVSILFYLVVLFFSRTFLDAAIPMDDRLLCPVLAMGLILITVVLAWLWKLPSTWVKGAVLLILIGILGVNLTRSLDTVRSYHENGRGYASARDPISETYAYLRRKPDLPIYSNAPAALYFWINRDTYGIPATPGVASMKADMQKSGAYLVIFDSIPVELYHVTQAELTQGLVVQIRLSEATIYRYP